MVCSLVIGYFVLNHAQLCGPMHCSPAGSSANRVFPGKNTGVGCHFLPGDLPDPGIESTSLVSSALAGVFFFTTNSTWEVWCVFYNRIYDCKNNWQDKAGSTGGPWETQKGSSEHRWASETSPRVGKAWHDLGGGGRVRAAGYTGQYVETGSLKGAHASLSETSLWLAFQASVGPVAPRSGWVLTSVQCSRQILEARSPQRRRSGPWQGKISHMAFIQWIERLEPQSWPDSQGPLPAGHFRIKFFHSTARMCQAQAPVTVSISKWGRAGVTCHWDSLWDRGPANHMGGKRPSFRGPGEASWAGGLLRAELPVWARTLGSCGQVFCSECPLCNRKAWW